MGTYDDWKTRDDSLGDEPPPDDDSVYCEACGGEGRVYRSRSGHPNDPDAIDCGPCPYCDDGIRRPDPPRPPAPARLAEPPEIDDFVPF
jgi:hypothetical protein